MSNKLYISSPILLCELLNKVLGDKYDVVFNPAKHKIRIYKKIDRVTVELEESYQVYFDSEKKMWVVVVED